MDAPNYYASSAAATLSKDKHINIRLSFRDLENIQMRAAEEGMPYQTMIASVLHKYASGRLFRYFIAINNALDWTREKAAEWSRSLRKAELIV